jgi:hypothetical protein
MGPRGAGGPGARRLAAVGCRLAAQQGGARSRGTRGKGEGELCTLYLYATCTCTVCRVPCAVHRPYELSQLRMQVINALAQRASSLTRVATIY